MSHADLPDAGRVSHFEIDNQLPTLAEKAALLGEPGPPSGTNRYLTENHAAGGFDGFANPTANVGLVAVNGVATTAMRSDGAPALDVGIVPTWTGLHTFEAAIVVETGAVGTIGVIIEDEPGQTASLQEWRGTGTTRIDAAGRLQIGTVIVGGAAVSTLTRVNDDGSSQMGMYFISRQHRSTGGSVTGVGGDVSVYADTNDSTNTYLMPFSVLAVIVSATAPHTNTVGTVYGLSIASPIYSGAGTHVVTNSYGVRILARGNAVVKNAYGLHVGNIQNAWAKNYAIYTGVGVVYFGDRVGVGATVPLAQLHVDQSAAGGMIPVLLLDQADVDQEMIEFACTIGVGNAIEAVGGKTLTVTHFIKVTLPGPLTRYIPVGTIA